MTELDKTMTTTFKRIRIEHEKNNVDIMQTISRLGKALVNMQQMFAQQAVHIILALPLNSSSRQCIFINTSPINERSFMLTKTKDLKREPDESEDIMCPSIIDYYVQRPKLLDGICLAEFASSYTKKRIKHKNQKKSYVIRYVKYNNHRDLDN